MNNKTCAFCKKSLGDRPPMYDYGQYYHMECWSLLRLIERHPERVRMALEKAFPVNRKGWGPEFSK